ncbi:MAG: tyrosine-type recombinase/integrase [Betaproteobacteria bacterium]|nr:tyrosine-type recombinase/integrase [Betaproteobacteria bacterium]
MNNTAKDILDKTVKKIDGAYSYATIRAYKADFIKFIGFCNLNNSLALPATSQSIVNFIIQLIYDGLCSASIRRSVAGISAIHRLNRLEDPTKDPDVNIEMRRMHRKLGRFGKQAYGVSKTELQLMVNSQDDSIHGIRNKALLLTAYDTLCRRGELIQLLVQDLKFNEDGTGQVLLRKSKVDQEAKGNILKFDLETTKAIKTWLDNSKIEKGFLFRGIDRERKLNESLSVGQINKIFKKIAHDAKLNKETINKISGHSFRVGAARDLAQNGNDFPTLMSKGRWSKIDTVMKYIQS